MLAEPIPSINLFAHHKAAGVHGFIVFYGWYKIEMWLNKQNFIKWNRQKKRIAIAICWYSHICDAMMGICSTLAKYVCFVSNEEQKRPRFFFRILLTSNQFHQHKGITIKQKFRLQMKWKRAIGEVHAIQAIKSTNQRHQMSIRKNGNEHLAVNIWCGIRRMLHFHRSMSIKNTVIEIGCGRYSVAHWTFHSKFVTHLYTNLFVIVKIKWEKNEHCVENSVKIIGRLWKMSWNNTEYAIATWNETNEEYQWPLQIVRFGSTKHKYGFVCYFAKENVWASKMIVKFNEYKYGSIPMTSNARASNCGNKKKKTHPNLRQRNTNNHAHNKIIATLIRQATTEANFMRCRRHWANGNREMDGH